MPRRKKVNSIQVEEQSVQIILFNYGDLLPEVANLAKESAIEIKAREKAIWENIIEIGNRLIKLKDALPHGQFGSWIQSEFEWSQMTARKYIKVAQELGQNRKDSFVLPKSFEALYQLASGLSNADEETKEEILKTVESKTEEKGSPLTEKEIKELLKKEQESSIEELKKFNKSTKITGTKEEQIKHLASKFELPESLVREILEKEEWKEGYKNIDLNYQQREIYIESLTDDLVKKDSEIRSLNSKIDCMQCGLDTLQAERAEVDLLQQELEERISREANILAQEQLEKERLGLEKKQKELDKQSKELQSDLEAVKKTKQNLNHFSDWLLTLEQFNHSFNEHTQYLISVFRKLQDLPKVEELEADDLANQKIYNTIREFHDNSDAFGRALTNLHGALRKVDNTVLKTIDVDKEVL